MNLCYDWTPVSEPPDTDRAVETKIHDKDGIRNEQRLRNVRRPGAARGLWYREDMSMYVYYIPTHWRDVKPPEGK